MTKATIDPIDNITQQARQGSMAAIIQVLNEQLADDGVRTRAVIAEGALQLLCEGATSEHLDQVTLVPRIKQILEEIAPRKIRHVNILSRIVREQQLLWFDEISRDPENQLLWSEKIIIKKPNLLQQFQQANRLKERQMGLTKPQDLPKVPVGSRSNKQKQSFWQGWVGGAGVSLVLFGGGWGIYTQFISPESAPSESSPSVSVPETSSATIAAPSAPTPAPENTETSHPFVEAVRLAQQAAVGGQNAQTTAEWLDLAAKWQRASELMQAVTPDDPRYSTAQDRVEVYRQNSESALSHARVDD